jgi:multisubunit Na+/H+ antiporter MnhC subunit
MAGDVSNFFWMSAGSAIVLFVIAAYCVTVSINLIRILIGLELFTKAVTLLLVVAGFATGRVALSQALVITLIVVEIVVIAVAAGVVVGAYQHTNSLDVRDLRNLKG